MYATEHGKANHLRGPNSKENSWSYRVGRLRYDRRRIREGIRNERDRVRPFKNPSSVCKQVKLEPLLRQSDVVTLHVHLTEETHHLMNAARLRMMKSTAVLMNTARGKIVDQTALLKALKGKRDRRVCSGCP